MSGEDFNLENEYGGLLDLIEKNISEIDDGSVMHYGVKGMHWGIRKERDSSPREPLKSLGPDSVSRKTKNGETITLQKVQPSKFQNFMGRHSKGFREGFANHAAINIVNSSGKKVGDAFVEKKNKDELYLEWLTIDKSERGKGYASAVMKAGRDFGKQAGFKKMTLEVPGNSPDARHIYEKLGFKKTGEVDNGNNDPVWGGLTKMEYNFDEVHHSAEVVHYGVKGMHWGVRKNTPTNPNYNRSQRDADRKKFGQGGVKRINRRLNKGHGIAKARKKEARFRKNRREAISTAVLGIKYRHQVKAGLQIAGTLASLAAGIAVQHVAVKAETKRGQAFAANTMGLPRQASTGPSYSKKNRSGVYNITSV